MRRHPAFVRSTCVVFVLAVLGVSFAGWLIAREQARTETERASTRDQKLLADGRHLAIRWSQYASNINLADQAWKRSDFAKVEEYLAACVPGPNQMDLRGFEWRRLQRWCRNKQPAWNWHQGAAYYARISPDGKRLATVGEDGVRIWDWAYGHPSLHGEPLAHLKGAHSAAWSPDGTLLATAGEDHQVDFWNITTWSRQNTLPLGRTAVEAEFSPDGKLLASVERPAKTNAAARGGSGDVVRLWDATSREPVGELAAHSLDIKSLAFSSDGSRLATGGGDRTALLWDVASRSIQHRLTHPSVVTCVAFAKRRPLLVTTYGGSALQPEYRRAGDGE